MLGKEGGSDGGHDGGGGNRKMYWRSASWSSSRMSLPPLIPVNEKDLDPNGGNGGSNKVFPAPLTPRSSSKNRSLLPPLSIARRSLDEWPKAGSDDVGEWPLPSTPSGERLKLDLSTIQRIPDKNTALGKREKIAFFDKKCSKVADHIFLGDSRGAFIIHIPSTIYLWIGQKCESLMERDARGAVCQIVRYEKVQGLIVVVKEGEEPNYFWDAFSNFLPLMDELESSKVTPGKRIIDSYNVDFEIFQKAIVGGFVPPFASSETEQETHLPARESSWSVLRRKFAFGNMKEFVLASKLSNLSLVSHKLSPHSISKSADFIDVNFTSIPSKSTPKCVNLPRVNDDSQAHKHGNLESSDSQNEQNQEPKNINMVVENELEYENVSQQVVAQEWPSLVKVLRVNPGNLDSQKMLIFTASSLGSGNLGECDLYLWIGKDFRHLDNGSNTPGANEGWGDPPDFDMKEVINQVLACMGLSENTRVKVVKQDKESSEFLELLSSL
ncbi:hypothetical protein L1987_75392 [Smallanthus sonchifolius]|uniref:Uncharacterized protein n=1 Tax=Smallanthus sonchifolius TaxID=185202 RepID=A0ACB9A6A3_9ASTR|nr:hypothetical protein L1987_75392 [Smallanthus sonchifolius]